MRALLVALLLCASTLAAAHGVEHLGEVRDSLCEMCVGTQSLDCATEVDATPATPEVRHAAPARCGMPVALVATQRTTQARAPPYS